MQQKMKPDPYHDFREKLTIMVVLNDITIDHAKRLADHVSNKYPHGNEAYCDTIMAALTRDLRSKGRYRNGRSAVSA